MANEFDALVDAALDGDEDRLKSLIAAGADLDQYDDSGQTPLLRLVFIGDDEGAELLLRYGADPNRPSRRDPTSTPLWHARDDFGLDKVTAVLLRFGAK
ncbi:MAG: ankyrin repeat domain-containing protein [Kofleriaceae bacterium]